MSTTPVKLYVYDLSNGMARQLSLQLTGRQIDGIWHTSVVVFGKEIFYGQGIIITLPGQSHHGSPLRVVDVGHTAIDKDTFEDYLAAMREHYTADKYHLLNFNCNSFTNDCIGFLTGGSIPSYITSLPSDFLSTPFGAALRPTIDAMFTGGANGAPVRPASEASLLQSVAAQATTGNRQSLGIASADDPPIAPIHITTNPASFHSLLRSHRAVIAFFTSATCGPCRMVEPVFEELAKSKSRPDEVGFAKIDLSVGLSSAVAGEFQVRVTPTFIFFLDGNKTHELKGVNAPELRTQVDLLIYDAFPPHAHTSLSLPAVEAISLDPILFRQVPNLDTMFAKLAGFIDGVTSWTGTVTQAQVKQTLSKTVLPFLKGSTSTASFGHWPALTTSLATNLRLSELFPLVDVYRIALLNAQFAAWNATLTEGPVQCLIRKAVDAEELPRNYQLTVLRMVANVFSNQVLAREVMLFAWQGVNKLLVDALLHADAAVRMAGASVGFNMGAYLQRLRRDGEQNFEENEEREVEIVAAVLDAIERETVNDDTVHRLVASLGLFLRSSPFNETMSSLLDGLGAKDVLKRAFVQRTEVRALTLEVADKLC